MPDWTRANLRPLYSGSETNVQVRRESEVRAPVISRPNPRNKSAGESGEHPPTAGAPVRRNPAQGGQSAQMRFEPRSLSLKPGQQATIGVVVDNVNDLVLHSFSAAVQPGGD